MKEGWVYGTINDFCNIKYGTRVVRRNVTGNKYPVYGGGGETFRMDEYNREDCLVVARFSMSKQCTRIVRGKFFLNDSGLTVSPIESSGLDANLLDRYLLASNDLIYSYGRGSAQINLNVDKFRNMPLSFPKSLSEQQRIVDYLDSAFAKIDAMKANAEKSLNEAKALFQASLKEMLEPKEGWEEKKLEDITEVKDGTHDSPKYVTEGIPFVTQKNITISGFDLLNTKKITLEDHKKFYTRSNVEFGDIIIAMIGANRGMSCIVDTREIFSIKNVGLIKKNDNINMRYLLFYLHSPSANTYILNNSNGGAQEFIGLKGLRTFPMPYPPLSEQQRIVETLDTLKSKVDRLQANFDKVTQECDALKQAILRQVFE
ncbi:MAG: restriction endonuclease subunit S [Prevotella sp.]|nr:restriction endonuclease subunit S [Prevotella sp.]